MSINQNLFIPSYIIPVSFPVFSLSLKPTLEEEITAFKADYERKRTNDLIKKKFYKIFSSPVSPAPSQCQLILKSSLKSIRSYEKSLFSLITLSSHALNSLLLAPSSEEAITCAKLIYKTIAAFLRHHTDPQKHKESYKHYLDGQCDGLFSGDIPSSYLADKLGKSFQLFNERKNKLIDQYKDFHLILYHLVKYLRKEIKLITHPEAIKKRVPDASDSALSYLNLTWLHGTKAEVIKTCCEKTEGELIPSGELKKKGVAITTGEIGVGTSSSGINHFALSGARLSSADLSIEYSRSYDFSLCKEISLFHQLLQRPFYSFRDLTAYYPSLTRQLEALKRVQRYRPDLFQHHLSELNLLVKKIRSTLDRCVFHPHIDELYHWHDDCHRSLFYDFLNDFEQLQLLIRYPELPCPQQKTDSSLLNIPVVFASRTRCGITAAHSVSEDAREEFYPGQLKLGRDIQVIFTEKEHITTVRELLKQHCLDHSIAVEPFSVLEEVQNLEKRLKPYFDDVYSLNKWEQNP
jgi:hypothetical protein